jgi:hypothetical protein
MPKKSTIVLLYHRHSKIVLFFLQEHVICADYSADLTGANHVFASSDGNGSVLLPLEVERASTIRVSPRRNRPHVPYNSLGTLLTIYILRGK